MVLFGLTGPICLFVLKPHSFMPHKPFVAKVKDFDWVGIILNAAVWTLFSVLFTTAGILKPWSSGSVIALFVAFGLSLLAFGASQYSSFLTTPSDRLFPMDLLRSKTLVLLYICQAAAAAVLFIPIYCKLT